MPAAQFAGAYHEDKAPITTRLQVGTTRGNPELVSQWNSAQSALDSLTGNINSMNALGTQIADIASRAHYVLNTIQATYNVSGAVDEDHRQLSVLEDETNQTIVLIDRLLKEVSDDIQRQTAYVANERANLTTLASAIKNGELYGGGLGTRSRPRRRRLWRRAPPARRWSRSASTIPMSSISRSSTRRCQPGAAGPPQCDLLGGRRFRRRAAPRPPCSWPRPRPSAMRRRCCAR